MGHWDNLRFPLVFSPHSQDTHTQETMKRRNSVTHAAQVVAALHAIQSGEAKSKTEAAAQAGIGTTALTPGILANTAKNPIIRQLVKTDPLDITAEVDGKRVSMREALAKGAESSVRTLATLAERNGQLSKAEQEQVRQCKTWLDLCRTMGMFREMDAPALPGELQAIRGENDDGPDHGSVEWYLLHGNTHEQPAGLMRVLPAPGETLEDQAVAKTGKVGVKPFQPERSTP
jgi:hypothetical protein